jgi:general L-amino acid transport system permease protein
MTDALPVGERRQLAPPVTESGAFGWARKNLFSSWANGITTVVLVAAIAWIASWFVGWAILDANVTASTGSECRGHGACWALILEKYRLIFFGTFPYDEQWRPLLAIVSMLAMLILTCDRRMWNARLILIWSIGSFVTFLLMFGQITLPLSLFLFVALAVGGLGMILRAGIARPAELNGWRSAPSAWCCA